MTDEYRAPYDTDCAIAASAIIHHTARLEPGCVIRGDALIGAGVEIGDRADIGRGAVICAAARVGSRARLGAGVVVDSESAVYADQSIPAGHRVSLDGAVQVVSRLARDIYDEAIPYLPAGYMPRHAAPLSRPCPDHSVGDQGLAGAHSAWHTA